jgi:hypothetical protein
MATLPKAIYMYNAIPTKILRTLLTEIEKSILKFIWKHQRPQIAKIILSKMSNAGGIIIPDFRLYNTSTAIKSILHMYKDQWNRI